MGIFGVLLSLLLLVLWFGLLGLEDVSDLFAIYHFGVPDFRIIADVAELRWYDLASFLVSQRFRKVRTTFAH